MQNTDRGENIPHYRSDTAIEEMETAYVIGEVLGQGAFGIVNKVQEKKTGEWLACKTMKKRIGSTSAYEQQEKEVRIMKMVDHENILKIHSVYETPAKIAIVMELCHGGELVQAIRKHNCSDETIRAIILQLITAVTYLHRNKIIHRDIKPENILLKSAAKGEYLLKMADFGLACFVDAANQVDNLAGTPMYMAKDLCEQILRFDPAMRITAGEIKSHPWLTNSDEKKTGNVIDLMRSYNAERRLKKAILTVQAGVRFASATKGKVYPPEVKCEGTCSPTVNATTVDAPKVAKKLEPSKIGVNDRKVGQEGICSTSSETTIKGRYCQKVRINREEFLTFLVCWMIRRLYSTNPLKLGKSSLQINLPTPVQFHYKWLRDNCQCELCVHPSTRQKLHSSGEIGHPEPISATFSNSKGLEIRWKDHNSIFDTNWLQKNDYNQQFKPAVAYKTWDAKQYQNVRETIDYEEFLTVSGFEKALGHLHDHGILFLKNVPTKDPLMVEAVAKKFGTINKTFYGSSFDVKSVPNSKNIAYTPLFLGLHMDLMYFEAPPGLQLLHCLENKVNGGTSLFMDLFKVVEELKTNYPKDYEVLKSVPVRFQYENDGKHYEYLRPTINESVNDTFTVFYSPPFQGPLYAHPSMVDEFYESFAVFERLIKDEKNVYKYLLKEGDVVLFANRRVLHGRESFDNSGNRWLKGCYVLWDDVKNQFRTKLKRAGS